MARRQHSRSFIRPAPKSKVWVGAGLVNTPIAASSSVLILVANAALLDARPFTVLRTRIGISYQSDQVAAAEFGQAVFALQVVTDSASAVGITAVPTPITEPDADFWVYQPLFQSYDQRSASGTWQRSGSGSFWMVDSKSMRKVGTDDDIVGTVENRSATGANIALEGRFLIQLH